MDYKLKGTVRRHISARVIRNWMADVDRQFSGDFLGKQYRLHFVSTKWKGKHGKRLKTTFLGRGKPV